MSDPHPEQLPVVDGPMAWTITASRSATRYLSTVTCRHGTLSEDVATLAGPPPTAIVIPTTARNLRNKTGCGCYLQPVP